MDTRFAKLMATLCLKLAGVICRRKKLKIVFSGADADDLHVVLDATSGEIQCTGNHTNLKEETLDENK